MGSASAPPGCTTSNPHPLGSLREWPTAPACQALRLHLGPPAAVSHPPPAERCLVAQVAGLTCDWLLVIVWGRLAALGPRPVPAFAWFGCAAACLHMAEILPLVALLVGLVQTPWIPGAPPQNPRP